MVMSEHYMQFMSTQSSMRFVLLRIDIRLLLFLQSLSSLIRLSGYMATE
jgi:hypothetical protein